MGRLDIATAGYMAALAPEAILELPPSRQDDAVRTQQVAATAAASPALWLRLLPIRPPMWESRSEKGPLGSAFNIHIRHDAGPSRPIRVLTQPSRASTYSTLAEDDRVGLVELGSEAGLRPETMLLIADWAWRTRPVVVNDPTPVPGEPVAQSWRDEGRRTKRDLLGTISAMRLRWAKRAGMIRSYTDYSPSEATRSALTRRINRLEAQLAPSLRPDLQNRDHVCAIRAMARYLSRRDGPFEIRGDNGK